MPLSLAHHQPHPVAGTVCRSAVGAANPKKVKTDEAEEPDAGETAGTEGAGELAKTTETAVAIGSIPTGSASTSFIDNAAHPNMRPGDWICPDSNCSNLNFASRMVCRRCPITRPGVDPAVAHANPNPIPGQGGGGGFPLQTDEQ